MSKSKISKAEIRFMTVTPNASEKVKDTLEVLASAISLALFIAAITAWCIYAK